jgi:hypothetical protein
MPTISRIATVLARDAWSGTRSTVDLDGDTIPKFSSRRTHRIREAVVTCGNVRRGFPGYSARVVRNAASISLASGKVPMTRSISA